MDTPTGNDPASGLPKTLRNILEVMMRENGLQSWQIFSHRNGVSVRIKFGEAQDGGQTVGAMVSEDSNNSNRMCYSKKSPSQMRRNAKRYEERRVTRQQSKKLDTNMSEIEQPRGELSETMASPSANIQTPIHVDTSSPHELRKQVNETLSLSGLTTPGEHVGHGECSLELKTLPLNHSHELEQNNNTSADCNSQNSDTDFNDADTDNDDFGPNMSLPLFRYRHMKPSDRRCTYCGAYKGRTAYCMMECTKDGRKICSRCIGDSHKRHRKYFVECKSNYVNDEDGHWMDSGNGDYVWKYY